jgi:hypothetical protein
MIDELNKATQTYLKKWQQFTAERKHAAFFKALKPNAVAWKTQDLTDFETRFAELRPLCDHISLTWMNDRWLAGMHLKDGELHGGISMIKLMQRRPDSTDAIGLDHLDFYYADAEESEAILYAEKQVSVTPETNGPHCKWLSIWFDGGEAKVRSDTVLDAIISDFTDIKKKVLAE